MKILYTALMLTLSTFMFPTFAQSAETGSYKAAIWVDPDGCEHWVLDLGLEGMMSPHLDREGRPVCGRPTNICMEFPGDMLFAVNESALTSQAVDRLKQYFVKEIAGGRSTFLIAGHTDSTGSELSNFDLSRARANAVAAIAQQVGGIVRAEAFGETSPIATNDTEDGKRRNRRVEIMCE